jgi:hypothetical protein
MTMTHVPDAFRDSVDALLERLACVLIVDGAAGNLSPARDVLRQVTGAVEAAGLDAPEPVRAALAAASAAPTVDALQREADRLREAWTGWKETGDRSPAPPEAPKTEAPADDDLSMLQMDAELASMFIAEALDHLNSIEALILQLEAEPGNERLLNDIFRPFHTIKGNSGALGVTRVQDSGLVIHSAPG